MCMLWSLFKDEVAYLCCKIQQDNLPKIAVDNVAKSINCSYELQDLKIVLSLLMAVFSSKTQKGHMYLHLHSQILMFRIIHKVVQVSFRLTFVLLSGSFHWKKIYKQASLLEKYSYPDSITAVQTFMFVRKDFDRYDPTKSFIHRSLASPALTRATKIFKMIAPHRQAVSKCLEITPRMWVFVSLSACALGSVSRRSAVPFMWAC